MSLIHVNEEDARFIQAAVRHFKGYIQSEGHPADPSVGRAIKKADEINHRLTVALREEGG